MHSPGSSIEVSTEIVLPAARLCLPFYTALTDQESLLKAIKPLAGRLNQEFILTRAHFCGIFGKFLTRRGLLPKLLFLESFLTAS
jgi:hypothetical protein